MMDKSFESTQQTDLFPEVSDGQDVGLCSEPRSNCGGSCHYCKRPVDTGDDSTAFEVVSWVRGKKKDSYSLREYSGRVAHGSCIENLKAGIAPTQATLDDALDAPKEPPEKLEYKAQVMYETGYDHGLEGRGPYSHSGMYHDDYMSGWNNGAAQKEVNRLFED
jgi:hypothetical protein